MAPPTVVAAADAAAAARVAADHLAARLAEAVQLRGRARLAVSGGSSPGAMFAALATRPVPWSHVEIFQVDERVAPDGDPERNATGLRRDLLDHIGIVATHVHLMPVTAASLTAAVTDYAALVEAEPLDVVHLGLGDDGHTASWPPGDPVLLEQTHPVAIVGPYRGVLRMTITPRVVDAAGDVLFLITGAAKRAALQRLLAGDPALPATRVLANGRVTVVHGGC